jgi:exonuclease VII large subunit
MAKAPLRPRNSAANISRRTLLGGIAGTPLAASIGVVPDPSAWEEALKAYSAAHYAYEAFRATSLQPAYALLNRDLSQSVARALLDRDAAEIREIRITMRQVEQQVRDAGGDRSAIVALRLGNADHGKARKVLAEEICLRRKRGRLMRRHGIFELEEQGNDLLAAKSDALQQLFMTPALDREGALLKLRQAYQEILRHEDHDGIILAIFADVERLWR